MQTLILTITLSIGRSGQPPPDVARAKRLAQAAAKLVEIVSPRQAVGSSSLKDRFKNSRREVVMIEECELARLATLFNIGVLSEVRPFGVLLMRRASGGADLGDRRKSCFPIRIRRPDN